MSIITDINWIYNKYYSDNPELRRIVTIHSEQVAKKALDIAKQKQLELDRHEIYCAAMLHDIGVVKCHAPNLHAFGELPYLLHGIEGQKILEENGLSQFASVCSRHTGAGISAQEIKKNNLPLPVSDYLPQTLLEKLICYSDKFFSKSGNLYEPKTLEKITAQMKNFGEESYNRFMNLHRLFGA